ncbi:LysM domain-containing protein [Paenibacillus pabuli]|uniref:LysM peptidoglycan-binding domain-containing protein n=1 Tax=Paenibacillus pabuli TaxID=1472 RepID=UPI00345891B1
MSFIKVHRKKEPPQLEQESNSIGKPAPSVPDSSLFNKGAQNLGTMVKEKYPQYGNPSSGTRHANIVSVVTIACVGLFFVLFFTTDLPGKILSASAAQPATAVTSVSGDSQLDPEAETTSSPRIVVISGANMTKEDLLTYVGDLPDDEVEMILRTFQKRSEDVTDNQIAGSPSSATEGSASAIASPSVDPVTSSASANPSPVDAAFEAEHKSASQINGSKRLKLIQDLNSADYLYYVAEDGDTLLDLSKAFGVSLGQLVEVNTLNDADVIRAGQILLFPGDTKQPDLIEK